jgi:hypothetical protein
VNLAELDSETDLPKASVLVSSQEAEALRTRLDRPAYGTNRAFLSSAKFVSFGGIAAVPSKALDRSIVTPLRKFELRDDRLLIAVADRVTGCNAS